MDVLYYMEDFYFHIDGTENSIEFLQCWTKLRGNGLEFPLNYMEIMIPDFSFFISMDRLTDLFVCFVYSDERRTQPPTPNPFNELNTKPP